MSGARNALRRQPVSDEGPATVTATDTLQDVLVNDPGVASGDVAIDYTQPYRFVAVVGRIFNLATWRVLVYTDRLCRYSASDHAADIAEGQPYWTDPQLIDAGKRFLQSDKACLEIIIGTRMDAKGDNGLRGSDFMTALIEDKNRRGRVGLYVRDDCSEPVELPKHNFIVGDDTMYGVETSDKRFKRIARFNNQSTAQEFAGTFKIMKRRLDNAIVKGGCTPLKITYGPENRALEQPESIAPYASFADIDRARYFHEFSCCPPPPDDDLPVGVK